MVDVERVPIDGTTGKAVTLTRVVAPDAEPLLPELATVILIILVVLVTFVVVLTTGLKSAHTWRALRRLSLSSRLRW